METDEAACQPAPWKNRRGVDVYKHNTLLFEAEGGSRNKKGAPSPQNIPPEEL